MSIGIAVATQDSVLLMADGRQSDGIAVLNDTAEKIVALRVDISLIVFGVVLGTDLATAWLRQPGALPNDAEAIATRLQDFAFASGLHVLQRVSPQERQMPRLKVGLIAGGLDTEGPFIAGALYGSGMTAAARVLARGSATAPKFIVLGGEETGSQAKFQEELDGVYSKLGQATNQSEGLHSLLLAAGTRTVRFAQARDSTIGGQIQWSILRADRPPETGFIAHDLSG